MSRPKSVVRNKVVVVTGAGSGIGRALALELGRRGARLALCDLDGNGLAGTVDLLGDAGADTHTALLDVADRAAVQEYAESVARHYGVVHQVYNNAGVAGGGRTVLDAEWEVYDKVLGVNLFGVIYCTKAFLPHLVASGDGHVVNISSLNGYMAQPMLSAYSASKFGVRGFTESLRAEMLVADSPVKVTVVHPGGVKTNIASAELLQARAEGVEVTSEQLAREKTYNEKLLKLSATDAARIIVDGVEAGSPRIRVGNDAKIVDLLVRMFPRQYPRLAVRLEQRIARWSARA